MYMCVHLYTSFSQINTSSHIYADTQRLIWISSILLKENMKFEEDAYQTNKYLN